MNVRPTLAGWYLFLASVQFLAALVLVVWQESRTFAEDGILQTILDMGQSLSPLVIIALVDSLLIVEGTAMLAERYLRERYNKGREVGREEGKEEGREEGREEGKEEGMEKGREEADKAWSEWNRRREEAEKEGRAFDEPPPVSSKSE